MKTHLLLKQPVCLSIVSDNLALTSYNLHPQCELALAGQVAVKFFHAGSFARHGFSINSPSPSKVPLQDDSRDHDKFQQKNPTQVKGTRIKRATIREG